MNWNAVAQGGLGAAQGDNFFNGFASGAISSIASSGFQSLDTKFTNSKWGGTSFGALSGGVGAELSGGNFWRGAGVGATVSLLNHYMHQVEGEWNEKRASNKRAKVYAENAFKDISLNDLNEAWSWMKDHFYIGADGEITYGAQLALTLKNGLGINLAPKHEVVVQGAWNNRKNVMPNLQSGSSVKLLDFGAAYYIGVNYNQTIDYEHSFNGIKTHTISVGALGFLGVTLNFDHNWNFIRGYGGIDISGKAAAVWGASGSLKAGVTF